MTDLIHAYRGRPAVVMGGGPSLPWHFIPPLSVCPIPNDAVLISANGHGMRLAERGFCRRPDFAVSVDEVEAELRPFGVPLVTRRPWADIRLFHKPVHTSGHSGAYLAWILGCSPVILVGMDMYESPLRGIDEALIAAKAAEIRAKMRAQHRPAERIEYAVIQMQQAYRTAYTDTYWSDGGAKSSGNAIPLTDHLARWLDVPRACPGIQLRAPIGSILADHFGAYFPGEPAAPAVDADRIRSMVAGFAVRFIKRHPRLGGHHEPGESIQVTQQEFNRLRRVRAAVAL